MSSIDRIRDEIEYLCLGDPMFAAEIYPFDDVNVYSVNRVLVFENLVAIPLIRFAIPRLASLLLLSPSIPRLQVCCGRMLELEYPSSE